MKYGKLIIMNTEIEKLLKRGVEEIFPSSDFLKSRLEKGEKLKIFAGIDPTGPTLHIGHAIVLQKLKQFQDLGHEIVLLIGDFTAQIGDPTDKMATRKVLTEADIKKNMKLYKAQASHFLRFSGKNKAGIVYNSDWLKKLKLKDVIDLTSLMTVEQMMKRDMFARRTEEGKPVFIHEFLYPIMQGYDSVVLNVDVEVGGNDQMFNMLVGRDFQKKLQNKEKVAITMKLLADANGKKMGKTENNMVSLNDEPVDMFGKIMSWTDGMILPGYELCTDVSDADIESISNDLKDSSKNPRDIKLRLAKTVVARYFGEKKAEESETQFINTFKKGEIPEDIQEVVVTAGEQLSKILVDQKIVGSVGEFKRLVGEGAVATSGGIKVEEFNFPVTQSVTMKVGKRRFIKIIVK
ncbi:MAG: hypothetical protein RL094_51 [Candidatus Parcubacteria bacterium]|jgi:tyrosyl-tRNA synthetase